ncbi:MAG TPA: hypothetical protein VEK07_06020 [Polyangiaceae bacterium]|nr:hypothetical protein [Polyangiaceae bacterium]
MKSDRSVRRLASFVTAALAAAAAAASCHSASSGALSANCSLNSDCNSPLLCVFSRCHNACESAVDCPSGERCVPSGTAGLNVCQLPLEQSCSGSTCPSGEVCVTSDDQCRQSCSGPDAGTGGCVAGGTCETVASVSACFEVAVPSDEPELIEAGVVAPDGAPLEFLADGAPVVQADAEPLDGTLPDGAPGSPGDGGSTDGVARADQEAAASACPSAQTEFGNTAQGDSNPNFTSGVGVRTATSLLIFSGYSAISDAGDGGASNAVYVQAFDPTTANSLGSSQPLFAAPPGSGLVVDSAAIAPTGEIALAFSYGGPFHYSTGNSQVQAELYGAFLAASSDAGPAGVVLQQNPTLIESGAIVGQPHVTWSVALGAFVFSWEYNPNGNWLIGTKNFHPNGASVGGTDPIPTDNANAYVQAGYLEEEQGSVASTPDTVGVTFQNVANNWPYLTLLDLSGNPIGSSILVAQVNHDWSTVGATAQGFVYVYDDGNDVSEQYLPVSADAGVAEAGDAGFAGFSFTGGIHAQDGHAINDDVGGAGGVGIGLVYLDGVSFAYVNSDGITHIGPASVISYTYEDGDLMNVTNFGGSFGLSIYSTMTQSTQMAASGCPQ